MTALERYYENEKLVYHVVNHIFPTFVGNEDLIQEGCLGLWKACNTYDESKDTQFSTYACQVIANEIRMYLRRILKPTDILRDAYSLDAKAYDDPNGYDYYDIYGMDMEWLDSQEFMKHLTDRQKRIVCLRVKGHTMRDTAERIGVSYTIVWRELQRIRKVWDTYI